MNKKDIYKKGFTALTAAIIASVMLTIGIAVLNITIKEVRLSSFARSSTDAFYTAGSGVECALFWDARGAFATSSDSDYDASVECFDEDSTGLNVVSTANSATTEFDISNTSTDTCATVRIAKDSNGTIIESRGYSTCNTGSSRRLERGLRVTY